MTCRESISLKTADLGEVEKNARDLRLMSLRPEARKGGSRSLNNRHSPSASPIAGEESKVENPALLVFERFLLHDDVDSLYQHHNHEQL